MRPSTRRKLKAMAKELSEVRQADLKAFLALLNPVPIDHPDWARNEIILRERERKLRQHRRIIGIKEARRDFVMETVDVLIEPKDFILCLRCGDSLPAFAQVTLTCSCQHLEVNPTERPINNTMVDIEFVRLTPRIAPPKPWWRFW